MFSVITPRSSYQYYRCFLWTCKFESEAMSLSVRKRNRLFSRGYSKEKDLFWHAKLHDYCVATGTLSFESGVHSILSLFSPNNDDNSSSESKSNNHFKSELSDLNITGTLAPLCLTDVVKKWLGRR